MCPVQAGRRHKSRTGRLQLHGQDQDLLTVPKTCAVCPLQVATRQRGGACACKACLMHKHQGVCAPLAGRQRGTREGNKFPG